MSVRRTDGNSSVTDGSAAISGYQGDHVMNAKLQSVLRKKRVRFGSAASAVVAAAYLLVPTAHAAEPSVQIELCGTGVSGTASISGRNQNGEGVQSPDVKYPADGCKLVSGWWWSLNGVPSPGVSYIPSNNPDFSNFFTCNIRSEEGDKADGSTAKCHVPA
jgi:hypothetical protein